MTDNILRASFASHWRKYIRKLGEKPWNVAQGLATLDEDNKPIESNCLIVGGYVYCGGPSGRWVKTSKVVRIIEATADYVVFETEDGSVYEAGDYKALLKRVEGGEEKYERP